MPTKGENFGHGIYGCLSVGLPVVISNQTPWQDSLGTLVCDTDDTEDYVSMITSLENKNEYLEAAFGALSTAQIYHRHLPKPDKFFEAIASVQITKY